MAAWYTINFTAFDNADFVQPFRLKDATGAALDLTGALLEMDIRDMAEIEVTTATIANGRIVITNATNGEFKITFPRAVMATIPAGTYAHDLILTRGGGNALVWRGALALHRGVTR